MKIYLVGGAVRDILLGHEPKDRDYVVVGATVAQMLEQGYRQVGKDFPVFLHPETQDEYALARVERKSGPGHTGFSVETANVTLEQDLSRRDLTINSMAMDRDGTLVDPFNGKRDLEARVLRNTTAAFEEDPLRVLRVARFIGRFGPDWSIEPGLQVMMNAMVAEGALTELPFERIWKELERGLMEPHPGNLLCVLDVLGLPQQAASMGALKRRFEVEALLNRLAAAQANLNVRFACAFTLASGTLPSGLPSAVADVAKAVQAAELMKVREFASFDPVQKLAVLDGLDVLRRPERLADALVALHALEPFDTEPIRIACAALKALDMGALAVGGGPGPAIQARIRAGKLQAITNI